MLVRKESKLGWGMCSNLVRALQGGFIQALGFSTPVARLPFSPQEQKGHLSQGRWFPAFRDTEGSQRAPPTPSASCVILIGNTQYTIGGYLEAVWPSPICISLWWPISSNRTLCQAEKKNVSKKRSDHYLLKTWPFIFHVLFIVSEHVRLNSLLFKLHS